ncbi:MAG: DegV family protein [Oscillospiraceae bacterium]
MNNYRMFTDATCDLSQDMLNELEVAVIPMEFLFGDKSYQHYPDAREMSLHDFYERLRGGEMPTTSQINVAAYLSYFEPVLKDDEDILYICFSSGLSGSISNARIAVTELEGKYPGRRIIIVDSLCASTGEGALVYYTARERLAGRSLDQAATFAEEQKLLIHHWFTVDDLFHLKRGGRISAKVAVAGTLMNIKPILNFNNEGKMEVAGKLRGRRKALEDLAGRLDAGVGLEDQVIFLSHGDCRQDAAEVESMIRSRYKVRDVVTNYIGPIIGAHSGPNTIAVFFRGKSR